MKSEILQQHSSLIPKHNPMETAVESTAAAAAPVAPVSADAENAAASANANPTDEAARSKPVAAKSQTPQSYTLESIRPSFDQKIKPQQLQQLIKQFLNQHLNVNTKYAAESCAETTKEITEELRNQLKEQFNNRYKFVVQCVMGEMRGEGVRMNARCFWDADTDCYAQDTFMNVNQVICISY